MSARPYHAALTPVAFLLVFLCYLAGPARSFPDCLLIVYRCTRAHSFPDCLLIVYRCTQAHSFPDCLLIVYRCTCTHSQHPPPWPAHPFPDYLLIVYRCTRTNSLHRYAMSKQCGEGVAPALVPGAGLAAARCHHAGLVGSSRHCV